MIELKRVYEKAEPHDGYRVLVDRLWPRGVSKERAGVSEWLKEAGPSDELRQWFGHDPKKYTEFKKRYEEELTSNAAFEQLQKIVDRYETVTLVYSAKDEQHNQAGVLKELLAK